MGEKCGLSESPNHSQEANEIANVDLKVTIAKSNPPSIVNLVIGDEIFMSDEIEVGVTSVKCGPQGEFAYLSKNDTLVGKIHLDSMTYYKFEGKNETTFSLGSNAMQYKNLLLDHGKSMEDTIMSERLREIHLEIKTAGTNFFTKKEYAKSFLYVVENWPNQLVNGPILYDFKRYAQEYVETQLEADGIDLQFDNGFMLSLGNNLDYLTVTGLNKKPYSNKKIKKIVLTAGTE